MKKMKFGYYYIIFCVILFSGLGIRGYIIQNKIKNEGKYIIAKFIKKENRPKTTHFYFAYYHKGKYTETLGTGIKYSILNSEEETRLINNLEINSFYKAKLHEDYPESIIVNPSKKVIDTLEIKLAGFEIN
ncbi:hypothetical protein [Flavobacterium sp.]|uniref:hypothetical protein n=1 Tax=Flavobacterium sp. TaxID=239 RepID=UPI0008CDAF59|nr:hypothetical protein [Flavobacterium sp.]OGS63049.1 MAG: hypothetical protein A2X07_12130 [Flavobacteria bacterium GWF1_32_7]HBD25843.1 hypothetical protein [Flavobacterium sp.]